jgi:DNA-3-methyladenine glycosylase II
VELKGTYPDDEIVAEVLGQVKHILGTEQDLAPFYRMALEDPELNPLAQELWGLHIPQTESIWEALVLAILGQQVSSHVAHIIRTLLVQTYGTPLKNSGITYHTFPSPEALMAAGVEGLRSIKLSRRKAQYIADIATSVTSGEKDLEGLRDLPDEEVTSLLTAIRGVGPWTAQWLLILGMGRTDGFPHGDLALRRALGLLLKDNSMPEPEEALRYSRRWSPFRSYATTYIFAALRSGRLAEAFARGNKEEGRRRKIS